MFINRIKNVCFLPHIIHLFEKLIVLFIFKTGNVTSKKMRDFIGLHNKFDLAWSTIYLNVLGNCSKLKLLVVHVEYINKQLIAMNDVFLLMTTLLQ